MGIKYVIGDATDPTKHGDLNNTKIIAHICNDLGGWGSGFVLAISKRWPMKNNKDTSPEASYRRMTPSDRRLGQIQTVWVQDKIFVCNMIAQSEMGGKVHQDVELNIPNVNYSSLYECLLRLKIECENSVSKCEIHMPRIGTGLGGGDWNKIESIIKAAFAGSILNIFIYDLPKKGK